LACLGHLQHFDLYSTNLLTGRYHSLFVERMCDSHLLLRRPRLETCMLLAQHFPFPSAIISNTSCDSCRWVNRVNLLGATCTTLDSDAGQIGRLQIAHLHCYLLISAPPPLHISLPIAIATEPAAPKFHGCCHAQDGHCCRLRRAGPALHGSAGGDG
jgi:hypothetical protein